jgi:hypothetical protein
MSTISLRISIPEKNATKMMQFDANTSVYDGCRMIREKLTEVNNMEQCKSAYHIIIFIIYIKDLSF